MFQPSTSTRRSARGVCSGAGLSRSATEGAVAACIAGEGRVGVLAEVNSETDFVAKNENFTGFVEGLVEHLAGSSAADLEAAFAEGGVDAGTERYHHNRTGEDNGDAHHKRQVMGREVVVAITNGELDFGPWEQIFYGEFDGRRPKRVMVKRALAICFWPVIRLARSLLTRKP